MSKPTELETAARAYYESIGRSRRERRWMAWENLPEADRKRMKEGIKAALVSLEQVIHPILHAGVVALEKERGAAPKVSTIALQAAWNEMLFEIREDVEG